MNCCKCCFSNRDTVWAVLVYFVFFSSPHLKVNEAVFWFMMQIGMTSIEFSKTVVPIRHLPAVLIGKRVGLLRFQRPAAQGAFFHQDEEHGHENQHVNA